MFVTQWWVLSYSHTHVKSTLAYIWPLVYVIEEANESFLWQSRLTVYIKNVYVAETSKTDCKLAN